MPVNSLEELVEMLMTGSIDFVGQKRTFDLQFYAIWTSGPTRLWAAGWWIHGYIEQKFLMTFYWIFGTSLIVTLLTLPAWPIWNRNPLEFLPAADKEKAAKKDRQQGGRLLWKGQKRLRWQEEQQGELRRGRPERWQQPPCSPETAPLPARALRPCRPSPARCPPCPSPSVASPPPPLFSCPPRLRAMPRTAAPASGRPTWHARKRSLARICRCRR
ncbi:unnamed protein product, partial [Prorocentrum cordatum]